MGAAASAWVCHLFGEGVFEDIRAARASLDEREAALQSVRQEALAAGKALLA